jgi:integrase
LWQHAPTQEGEASAAATLMLAEGVPVKVVSEMLGHADVATTLRVYAHVMPTMQRAAVSVLGRLLGGS